MQATLNDIQHYAIDGNFTSTNVPGHFLVIWSQRDNEILAGPLKDRMIEARSQMVTAWAHASHFTAQDMPGAVQDLLGVATHTMAQVYRDAGLDEEHVKGRVEANQDILRNAMTNSKVVQRTMSQAPQMAVTATR